MSDLQHPETDQADEVQSDVAMWTFGFVVAIALTLIAFSFFFDFFREIF
ncbi:MAG: hypothetical protein AAGA99_18550 [Actinomycetota bacterium]